MVHVRQDGIQHADAVFQPCSHAGPSLCIKVLAQKRRFRSSERGLLCRLICSCCFRARLSHGRRSAKRI